MNVSRQAYYKRQDKIEQRQKADTAIISIVKSERTFHPSLGGRKLYFILK